MQKSVGSRAPLPANIGFADAAIAYKGRIKTVSNSTFRAHTIVVTPFLEGAP